MLWYLGVRPIMALRLHTGKPRIYLINLHMPLLYRNLLGRREQPSIRQILPMNMLLTTRKSKNIFQRLNTFCNGEDRCLYLFVVLGYAHDVTTAKR